MAYITMSSRSEMNEVKKSHNFDVEHVINPTPKIDQRGLSITYIMWKCGNSYLTIVFSKTISLFISQKRVSNGELVT